VSSALTTTNCWVFSSALFDPESWASWRQGEEQDWHEPTLHRLNN
jgi:hypothetical protein